jgi:hypothetical protein
MILIYVEKITPRLEYTCRLLFGNLLGTKAVFTSDPAEFRRSDHPKINYSSSRLKDELYLKPHPILFENHVTDPYPEPVEYQGEKYFFKTSADSFLPFDPLAASFFLVTRFEEYLEKERGPNNRYPHEKSILSRYNLLKKPVVHLWANLLAKKIRECYPKFTVPEPQFRFLSTIDVDNAWAFTNKGWTRNAGALVKDLITGNHINNMARIRTWLKKQQDPYDTYHYLNHIFHQNRDRVIFFFLVGDYKKYDKNIRHTNKAFRNLIRETAREYDVGIHPSYFSSEKRGEKNLTIEIERLNEITGKKTVKSRQHYLRLFFPETYCRLISHGITEDYSMGYSASTGFRAGLCNPYPFFDLYKNQETNLVIFPFQVMDVTLRDYLQMDVEEAKKEIDTLMQEVKKAGGTFTGIWHNESLSNHGRWKGYREVFEYMNRQGFRMAHE